MLLWLGLLGGGLVFGAAIVATLVLPRTSAPLGALIALPGMFGAIVSAGAIMERYNTAESAVAAVAVLLGGITAGFGIAAAALPLLARPVRARVTPGHHHPTSIQGGEAVILVACADPERYSPRAVARRQNLLAESAAIEVPATALPFVFFAEKARYRAIGRRAPGTALARQLVERIGDSGAEGGLPVGLAWCHTPDSLTHEVETLTAAGATRIGVVVLGTAQSGWLEEIHALLDASSRREGAPQVTLGPSLWHDRLLPERMCERIIAATVDKTAADVGVVLVAEGAPPEWERRYAAAAGIENYFAQRVRVLLGEAGVTDLHTRVAWLAWQTPDVTEAVRHVAALGCTRVVVAPMTFALPTLETVLDLGHAVSLARVPEGVQVVVLPAWGDDEAFSDAVRRSAAAALAELGEA